MSYLLASAARATVGARSGQEDAYRVWPAEGTMRPVGNAGLLAVLADGMGGHRGGAVAGQTACATFTESFAATDMPYDERLNMALHASNEALAEGVERNAALKGMGCTLIGAWFDDTGVRWTSVGDSLLLLYRFPDVIRLNEDHSLGSYLDEQARRNEISHEEALGNRHRNALRSALTGSKIDLIDLRGEAFQLMAGDWIILASDGIASLEGDELADIMYRYRSSSPDEMAAGLIAAVEEKQVPEQDNTTVVVVRVDGASETAMRRPGALSDDDAALKTRRIGVVSGRKAGGIRAKAPAQPRSAFEGLPMVLLLAAGIVLVAAAAYILFTKYSRPVEPTPVLLPPPEIKSIEKNFRPDSGKQPPPSQPPTTQQPPAPQPVERAPRGGIEPRVAPQPQPQPPAVPVQPKSPPQADPASPGGPGTGPGPGGREALPPPPTRGAIDPPGRRTAPADPPSTISEPTEPSDPDNPTPPGGGGGTTTPVPQQGSYLPPPRPVAPRKVDRTISAPLKQDQPKAIPLKKGPRVERETDPEKVEVPRKSQ